MVCLSSKNPGKKNKAKLEKAAAEKAAEDRKKARKTASKDEKKVIKAEEKEAKKLAKEKAKKKADKAKSIKKTQRSADREARRQERAEYDAEMQALKEKSAAALRDDEPAEEETEAVTEAVTDAEEETVADAVSSDTETEEAEETEETEEPDDTDEEEEEKVPVCICCGEANAQTGKEYCSNCERLLIKTRLPLRGFVISLVMVIFSFFVLIIMGLDSSSALQVFKGDYYVSQKNYNTAFTAYDDVSSVVSEITDNFGDDSLFTKLVTTGSEFDLRAMECAVKMYGPLDAIDSFDSNIFTSAGAYDFKQHSAKYKELYAPVEEFNSTVSALNDILTEMGNDESLDLETYESRIPEMEEFIGQDGVNEVYLEYIITMVAENYFEIDSDKVMEYLEKVDAAARKDGGDYSWLYYETYTTLLVQAGDTESATPYLLEMMENDVSNYYSRAQMCRILVSRGETESAAAIVNEFQSNNTIDDEYTEDAYALLIYMSRVLGNYETALHYATASLETYTYVPEIRRQQALAYMSMGYYAEAFDAAYQASSDANYISSYFSISDFDGNLLDETLYIAAYLAKDVIADDEDAMANYEEVMATYSAYDYVPPYAQKVIDGEIDITTALTEGTCDFI